MKIVWILAAASLGLAGCGSMDFWGESSSAEDQPAPVQVISQTQSPPPTPAPAPDTSKPSPVVSESLPPPSAASQDTPTPVAPAVVEARPAMADAPIAVVETTKLPPNAHCMALAKQRAIDAAYQGEDGDTQEAVHERTYAECVTWDLKHAYSR